MQEFLEYWAAHPGQQDDGKALYDKYQRAQAAVEGSRRKTLKYIIPVNGSKGWHPGFDPEATAEIVALAAEIEAANSTLKSISQDIEEFMAAVGGPVVSVLATKRAEVMRHLADGRYKAKAAGIKAGNRYPNLSPAEIRMQDEVMRADIAFEEIREKLEPELTDLEARIHKAHEIAMR